MTIGWIQTWAKIAEYCQCCERTAKKRHKVYGMPVHRLPGTDVACIIPAEVQAWLQIYSDKMQRSKAAKATRSAKAARIQRARPGGAYAKKITSFGGPKRARL